MSQNKFAEVVKLVDFDKKDGLVTAIAQDYETDEILMVAHMTKKALKITLEQGQVVYWSRSREKLWHKGEESGNVQIVREIYIDCDGDALLLKVDQVGGSACHTGKRNCFFRRIDSGNVVDLGVQVFDPDEVYKK